MGHGKYADASPEQTKAAVASLDKTHALRTASQRPSIGRVVRYTPAGDDLEMDGYDEPGAAFAAIIASIEEDERFVRLAVFDRQGKGHGVGPVALAPPGVVAGADDARGRWSWPEYVPPRPTSGEKSSSPYEPSRALVEGGK